ncbi:MAG: acyltransferase family protein [Planctomycetota bacterium]|jgi:peptidoglycan/LPS O-acetylase OafA/YrhL
MTALAPKSRSRRRDIDVARAIAAFAVVMHHIPQYFIKHEVGPFNADFGTTIIQLVNFIHIPTFMLLAGFVLALGAPDVHSLSDYGQFVRKKALRLMLPFLSISLLHLLVKLAARQEGMSGTPQAVLRTFIAPMDGLAGHLWFLYCLMTIFLIWPLLMRLVSVRLLGVVFAAMFVLAVAPISWPTTWWGRPYRLFGLRELVWYVPIFVLGFWYASRRSEYGRPRPIFVLAAGLLFAGAWLLFMLPAWPEGSLWEVTRQCVRMFGCIAAGLFVLWFSGLITAGGKCEMLCGAGRRSYDIYLLHVALVGHPLVFLAGKLHPGAILTYVLFATLPFVTYILAVAIGQAIRRFRPLAFVMLGVPYDKRRIPAGTGRIDGR